MGMTMLEKILASHSGESVIEPGKIIDVDIDIRVARDFGGANVVKHMKESGLVVDDPSKTLFTFDCNPTGSDQKYTVNQHICRLYAREKGIKVFDIDSGIGTHIIIDNGFVHPGSTAVSTDSHANILGAIGAFGQGMGDMDIASAWNHGRIWFKVPPSVQLIFKGKIPENISSKDLVLNILARFGANTLLGYSVEISGDNLSDLSLDDRITISSMATEMGAIIILFPPSDEVVKYCRKRSSVHFEPFYADHDANYDQKFEIDISSFKKMVSKPGEPHDAVDLKEVKGIKIDSAFIGSCTNGRMSDMRETAAILKNRKVAPGVMLKIVPATNSIWNKCLEEGIIGIFKSAGAIVANAGCAGCAAGQVGQNGQDEITISTGNRNFPGKQGKGSVYLASPETVAASAVAGYITDRENIPDKPAEFAASKEPFSKPMEIKRETPFETGEMIEGNIWVIGKDNIDTDMIFHNRYLSITDMSEMGQYAFDNLKGYEDFSKKAKKGDIVVTGKNFGCGSSRQQAVDCFMALGIGAVVAESFGSIYERNAINAAFPVVTMKSCSEKDFSNGDRIRLNLKTGEIENLTRGQHLEAEPFSKVQYDIYRRGGLLKN
jgi:homoaconitate hydratase family protein/3-isopropylmalate dehydratase small subunit